MNVRRILVGAGVLLAALVVVGWVASIALTGASVGGSTEGSVGASASSTAVEMSPPARDVAAAPDAAMTKEVAASEAGGSMAGSVSEQRAVVRTASVTLTVDKVPSAVEKLRALIAAAGGEVDSLSYSAGTEQPYPLPIEQSAGSARGPQSATVVIRVPAGKLEPLSRSVARLGEVTAQSAAQDDITAQVVDLDARLRNLRAEEIRLRSFLDKAVRVSDMLSIERELARVRGEIEAMQAQQRYLKDQVAMATLTVSLSQPAPVVSPAGTNWGFGEAVTRGVQAAATVLGSTITVGIALLPLAAGILLVWWLVALWRRRHRGHREAALETE